MEELRFNRTMGVPFVEKEERRRERLEDRILLLFAAVSACVVYKYIKVLLRIFEVYSSTVGWRSIEFDRRNKPKNTKLIPSPSLSLSFYSLYLLHLLIVAAPSSEMIWFIFILLNLFYLVQLLRSLR